MGFILRTSPSGELLQGSSLGDLLVWDDTNQRWTTGPGASGLDPGTELGQIVQWDGLDWVPQAEGNTNQFMRWNPSTLEWDPGTFTANLHDDSDANVQAHYPFQGNGNDAGPNGLDLVVNSVPTPAPVACFSEMVGGLLGSTIGTEHDNYWERTVSDAQLRISGALTIMMLLSCYPQDTDEPFICNYGGVSSGNNPTNNIQYALRARYLGAGLYNEYFSSSGARVINRYPAATTPETGDSVYPFARVGHFGFTRSAGQILRWYTDGKQSGSASPAQTAPDGGTTARFLVGGSPGFSTISTAAAFTIASLIIYDRELSAGEVLDNYNFTLGAVKGIKS